MPFFTSGDDRAHAALVGFLASAYVAFVASGALPSERAPARRSPSRVLLDRAAFALVLGAVPLGVFGAVDRPLPGGTLLGLGDPGAWGVATGALCLVAGAIAYGAPKSPADLATYPQYLPTRWSVGHVALEIGGWALYLFAYEAVFRGVLLTLLLPTGTLTAIALQTALYAFAHFPKSQKETQGSLLFGVIAALLTLGFRTIWPAFLVHLALALGNDASCARLAREPPRADEAR